MVLFLFQVFIIRIQQMTMTFKKKSLTTQKVNLRTDFQSLFSYSNIIWRKSLNLKNVLSTGYLQLLYTS